MNTSLSRWPNWLRWILVAPAALVAGAVAGIFLEFINAAQAESSNAPILYIAAFLGGLASHWVALYTAHGFAPSHKRAVVITLAVIGMVGNLSVVHLVIDAEEYRELLRIAGAVIGCYVFWNSRVRTKKPAGRNAGRSPPSDNPPALGTPSSPRPRS